MKAALLSQGSTSSKWTAEAMRKYFDVVDEINLKEVEVGISSRKLTALYDGKEVTGYDCVYAKGSFRYEAILRAITVGMQDSCYMPTRPEAFTIGNDKLITQLVAQKQNIPMPNTYLAATAHAGKKILEKISYPAIMKFPQGTQGKGVMFADSFASASSMLDALDALRQPLIIQEFVETGGVDTRIIVVGEKVVAAMHRKAKEGEARANIHAGGTGESAELSEQTKRVAIETARAMGSDIVGVDILDTPKGPYVIEVNLSPGLQGITKATGINVADKIAKFLYEKTKEFKKPRTDSEASKILEEVGIEQTDKIKEIITNLDFRGSRILLPELISRASKLTERDEVVIKVEKGSVVVDKI